MTPPVAAGGAELVCEALGRRLASICDAPLFGLAGSGNLELIAAFTSAGGAYHAANHETGAVAMADGWAQASGDVGLATLHQGPGLTNGLTALVDAAKARTPMLVIVAEIPAAAGHSSQWIEQRGVLEALGVALDVRRLEAQDDPAAVLAALLASARRHRRPAVLLAPVEVQRQAAAVGGGPGTTPRATPRAAPDPDAVAALTDRLLGASRPVILAGRGAVLAGAGPALTALADGIGALLATTAPAHGLFDRDPFALGIAGGFASPLATRLLGDADLVLVAGASLDSWTTCEGRLFAQAAVERIDTDALAGGVTVAGDAGLVADELLARIPAAGRRGWRTPELEAELAGYCRADDLPAIDPAAQRLHPGVLCRELERRLPEPRTLVLDSGHFMAWPAMLSTVGEGGAFLFGQAFQAVGLGIARGVGAAVARPDRATVALVGDGGAMMAVAEIDTAVRVGAPLLVVVMNDSAYGAEVHDFAPLGVPVDAALFPDRDLAGIARAMGCDAVTVRRPADLGAVDAWCAERSGPLVVDVKVDPDADAVSLMTPLGVDGWSPAPRHTEGTRT